MLSISLIQRVPLFQTGGASTTFRGVPRPFATRPTSASASSPTAAAPAAPSQPRPRAPPLVRSTALTRARNVSVKPSVGITDDNDDDAAEDNDDEREGLEELLQRWESEQRSRRRSTRQRKPVSRNLGKDSRYPETRR